MEVIELSDSDESEHTFPTSTEVNRRSINVSDFDFPAISFAYEGTKSKDIYTSNTQDSAFDSVDLCADIANCSFGFANRSRNISLHERDINEPADENAKRKKKRKSGDEAGSSLDCSFGSSDSLHGLLHNSKEKQKKTTRVDKNLESKQKKKEEKLLKDKALADQKERLRLKKQEVAAEKKALKAAKDLETAKRRELQIENCLKAMKVVIDESLQSSEWYPEIIEYLNQSEIGYVTKSHMISESISWKRISKNYYLDEDNELRSNETTEDEDQIVVLWDCRKVIDMIADETFTTYISELCYLMPNKTLNLVILGINDYFKNRDKKGSKNLPKISKKKLESCLVEIQLMNSCNSRLVETKEELALMVYHYTKALAEKPSRLMKRQELETKVDWFAKGDNRDTVKVDKNGYGLKRLWQQQLSEFTLSSLETAEAISAIYKSPIQLLQAYENCSATEGQMLLRDIPIRRAAGLLSSTRKIGPELSKKVYVMFTSKEGTDFLT